MGLRIAMLAPFAMHPKGTTRWRVVPLACALAAMGHQVRVIVPPYDWPAHAGHRWQEGGLEIINLSLPSWRGPARWGLMAAHLFREALAWQPDVVHLFKPQGPAGLACWLYHHLAPEQPWVVDTDDWEAGWHRMAGLDPLQRRLLDWQERWSLRQAAAVTAASRWLVSYATGLRAGEVRVFYLPNGVESGPRQEAFGPDSGRPVLLYTRFVEHTPDQVWQVWRSVLEKERSAHLLVAGRGLHHEQDQLALLAARAGHRESLSLLGWVPGPTRPGLFAAVAAAMLPVADTPLNRAKSPMRLLDLLAAGVAVVTQNVGEYAVYASHDRTGLVAPAADPQALAQALIRLLRDAGLRSRLGAAARQHMQEHHAWPKLARTALAAYESALGGQPGY